MGDHPFFIVGFQRSGTTLLRVMLDAHPDVAIPLDPVGLWDKYERRLDQYAHLRTPEGRSRIVKDLLAEERIQLWQSDLMPDAITGRWKGETYPGLIDAFYSAHAASRGKRLWGDKDPGNMTRIDQLNRWFPGCRIVHIVRDGRDACLSHLKQSFGYDDVIDCASSWREEVEWVRRMGSVMGEERYHELRYEDLVSNPASELGRLCTFLDIRYDEEMLAYHANLERSVPDSKRHIWPKIGEPPRADNAGRWRSNMSPSQRVCFEKRAGRVLTAMGYDVLPGHPSGEYFEETRRLVVKVWKLLRRKIAH